MQKIKDYFKKYPFAVVVITFIIVRVIIFLMWPVFHYLTTTFQYEIQPHEWNSNFPIIGKWLAFDSEHYLTIAREGYNSRLTAFFPLYPLLMKFLSTLTFIPLEWSGIIISNLSFIIALYFIYKILQLEDIDSNYSLILLIFSPITIYFITIYTESLYLLFTSISFYLIRKKNWFKAAVVIGIAALTRNSGIVLYLCWLIEFIISKDWKKDLLKPFLGLLIGGLIMISYPLYLWFNYGNPTLYVNVQSIYWDRFFRLPWQSVINDIKNLINSPAMYTIVVFNLIFMGLVIWMTFSKSKIRVSYKVFAIFSTFMPLCYPFIRGGIPWTTGVSRYVLVLFPLYIFIADKIKNKLARIALIEVSIGFMILFITAFIGKQFIG